MHHWSEQASALKASLALGVHFVGSLAVLARNA